MVIAPAELETLQPKKSKTIEIEDFVELSQIDPIFYDHPYYLAPGTGGAKPYRLLLEAMQEDGRVAIARFVMRSRSSSSRSARWAACSRWRRCCSPTKSSPPERLDEMPDAAEVKTTKRELDVAKQLVELARRRLRARQLPRHLPRGGARADRAQGAGRGDRGAAAAPRSPRAGARPDERAEGESRRGARAHGAGRRGRSRASRRRKRAAAKKAVARKPAPSAKKPAAKKPAAQRAAAKR